MGGFRKIAFFITCSLMSIQLQSEENTTSSLIAIERKLEDAEKEFNDAKKIFNPWYVGPLLAPSAHLVPPGYWNIQPYLFVTANYGKYQQSGSVKKNPTLLQLNPVFITQFGMIDWMDGIITIQGLYNKQNGESSFNIGDLPLSLGFGLLKEKAYTPAVLFSIKESFPTGKYQHLDPEKGGVDATGSGSYQTTFYLNSSKVVWWWSLPHPMAFRLSLDYTIPSAVHVKGFNAYGGGYHTNGKVHPGQSFSADFGYEFSFTQTWVGALDIVYNYTGKTTFSGKNGITSSGVEASVGGPFNDQVSLAPAIEYNVNENLGFIVGAWFSVWGRNSTAFASAVFSFDYTF